MGSTLQREGPAATTPMQLSSFPAAGVYFGSGQQTPLEKEEPRGTGAGRGHLKTTGLVKRQCKTSLTKILSLGWVGRGGFQDCSMMPRAVRRAKHTQTPGSWQTSIS